MFFLKISCLADAEPLSERSLNFGRETKENYISVFSLQLTADLDIYEWICVKRISVNKVRPWSQKNVHHWEDEVGEEVVVNLGEFPPEGGRIPESRLKVVSYALGDHCNL